MKRIPLVTSLAVFPALLVAPGALAVGGPVTPVQGSDITVAGSPYRYAALDGGANTVITRVRTATGSGRSELAVSGRFGLPGVDVNGSTTGLSADGGTLVLAELPAATPPRATRLLVLDTVSLAVRARLTLPGWSTVDAISPDGRWLYLIHYTSANAGQYEVLAYDLLRRRFLAAPVVDPRERDEAMTGIPLDRVMSSGGRWAYTLYFRPAGVPFIHALDTTRRHAVCIDLPSLRDVGIGNAKLVLGSGGAGGAGGAALRVTVGGATRAVIDTRTFGVAAVRPRALEASVHPAVGAPRGDHSQDGVPWMLIVLALLGLGVAAGVGAVTARRAPTRERPRRA